MFEEALATFTGTTPATVVVWLIPLTAQDAAMVKSSGWERFEELLETTPVDFWNLDRASVLLG